ncbi:hypothetical protein HNY73_012768 [Argiope bruennichi]|uniref:Uncharacterized protein n=1 Tax=Argiope bruennichi TaxID=94029 RepID=A0A8T0EWL6_ARGBR|nr:hypothetical protein HNY73_012768 [Argiope bruennichi]
MGRGLNCRPSGSTTELSNGVYTVYTSKMSILAYRLKSFEGLLFLVDWACLSDDTSIQSNAIIVQLRPYSHSTLGLVEVPIDVIGRLPILTKKGLHENVQDLKSEKEKMTRIPKPVTPTQYSEAPQKPSHLRTSDSIVPLFLRQSQCRTLILMVLIRDFGFNLHWPQFTINFILLKNSNDEK